MENLNFASGNVVNPLLMNFTPSTKIQEETENHTPLYDEKRQISYEMVRTIGTKCLKTHTTKKPKSAVLDKKNDIDDSKTVK